MSESNPTPYESHIIQALEHIREAGRLLPLFGAGTAHLILQQSQRELLKALEESP